MLSAQDFNNWCAQLNLTAEARKKIEKIRAAEPSRRVQGGRRNVSGSYPSRKMGLTIQFESHRNELAHIYELEHDPNILEYYDQPPAIELCYPAKSGRMNRHLYTPDFFVLRHNSAGWEECKTEADLNRLANSSPNRYGRDANHQWHCLPGEEYAARFGLYFQLWSGASINWVFQQNFIWLEDYLGIEPNVVAPGTIQQIQATVQANLGISLVELLKQVRDTTLDDLYSLIATRQIYVNLHSVKLLEPERVQVFLNEATSFAYQRITQSSAKHLNHLPVAPIKVGTTLDWDGACWQIINIGNSTIALQQGDSQLIELPTAIVKQFVEQGRIAAQPEATPDQHETTQALLSHASPQDIEEANHRYTILQPYLTMAPSAQVSRTIRRWRNAYQQAAALYGNGYIGLLPQHHSKGNRQPKLDEKLAQFMIQFIEEQHETIKQRGQLRVYEAFCHACAIHQPSFNPPSLNRFRQQIHRRSGYTQTLKRQGRRAALQQEAFYWELELTTPRHGSRPFEVVHIDHTQLDVELVSSLTSLVTCQADKVTTTAHSLGRPWATFMVDAYSRRLLAVYLTFEEPSYRTCMSVLRIGVQRFKRFPQTLVVDNGPEFHSRYFEQLLATYRCTRKYRPPASARFGSVVERLFGTANTQLIYELRGNTQITRQHRQVPRSVQPENQAVWTLGDLYEALCHWAYEIYDQREHPALGQNPREAFTTGIAQSGNRLHRQIDYNETFRILTMPAPERGQRKVQPGQGVKVHNIYYWSNLFRDPEVEGTGVDVRYDPFDASVAYAFVKGRWVQCVSAYSPYLQGRSEKEIQLASAELYKRRREQGRKSIASDKELVEFLNSVAIKEGELLKQRLKTNENYKVLQLLDKTEEQESSVDKVLAENLDINITSLQSDNTLASKTNQLVTRKEKVESSKIEFYGEF